MSTSTTDAELTALPDGAELARLVSDVTDPMCGITFTVAADQLRGQSICGRMFLLPIPGPRDISIVLSTDAAGCESLGAAMFRCPPEQLTRRMADDAIRELLNMVAGQIQRFLEIDQQLGLPRAISLAELTAAGGAGFADAQLMTSNGAGDIKMWIFEKTAGPKEAPVQGPGFVRSLFRKFTAG